MKKNKWVKDGDRYIRLDDREGYYSTQEGKDGVITTWRRRKYTNKCSLWEAYDGVTIWVVFISRRKKPPRLSDYDFRWGVHGQRIIKDSAWPFTAHADAKILYNIHC